MRGKRHVFTSILLCKEIIFCNPTKTDYLLRQLIPHSCWGLSTYYREKRDTPWTGCERKGISQEFEGGTSVCWRKDLSPLWALPPTDQKQASWVSC